LIGIPQNLIEAVKYYKLSADQQNGFGLAAYGSCYQFGKGVSKDMKRAVQLYKQSADMGNSNGQLSYGVLLHYGWGIPVNLEESVRYFKLAADQGNQNAQATLAICIREGLGIAVNGNEAARIFKDLADKEDPEGYFGYGVCLEEGIGVEINLSEAQKYYELAFAKGSQSVLYMRGMEILQGRRESSNPLEAVELFRQAGDTPDAGFQLGLCYAKGIGVKQDRVEAKRRLKQGSEYNYEVPTLALWMMEDDDQ
jgi:TPR repeat protein